MSATAIALLTVSCIFLILIIVFGSLAIINQDKLDKCEASPASWCFDDWKCLNPKDPTNSPENPVTVVPIAEITLFGLSGTNVRCSNLNEETVKQFTYSDGENIYTKYPEYEVNIWSLGCNPKQNNCPFYTVGDVYWPACSSTPTSKFYTPPEVYNKLAAEAVARKNAAEKVT